MKKFISFLSVGSVALLLSCADLEIENFNEANFQQAANSPEDIFNFPGGAFVNWHQAVSTVNAGPALACNADVLTCAWGNFGIRNFSWQPPIPVNNSLTSNDAAAISDMYGLLYGANSLAVDVELFVTNPANQPVFVSGQGDVTDMLHSVALFLEGVSHGYAGMIYDKGFRVDASTDLGTLQGANYGTYEELRDFAVAKLEEAATIADGTAFTMPATWINGLTMTNVQFARLARTAAAQIIVLNARNATENAATDWAKVATLTAGGIQADFAPIGDDNLWFDDVKLIGGGALVNGVVAQTWARVDVKVMNLMDPNYPTEFPAAPAIAGPATTADLRLASDFVYRATNVFPENRGTYRFSNYIHNRYAATSTAWNGLPMVKIKSAENDLMRAEALVRTAGNKVTAAGLINITRVGRGGLPALTGAEADQVLLDAIKYEKIIELMNTTGGRELSEVRRWGGWLRDGAFEQLPVNGAELTLLGVPIYTFGGVN